VIYDVLLVEYHLCVFMLYLMNNICTKYSAIGKGSLEGDSVAVAAWRNGNGVGRINEVTLRRVRLVLGLVTCQ